MVGPEVAIAVAVSNTVQGFLLSVAKFENVNLNLLPNQKNSSDQVHLRFALYRLRSLNKANRKMSINEMRQAKSTAKTKYGFTLILCSMCSVMCVGQGQVQNEMASARQLVRPPSTYLVCEVRPPMCSP